MPRLPSVEQLGQSPTPAPQRGLYGYRAGQVEEVQLRAAESMVRTGQQIMQAAEGVQSHVDRLEFARAKSDFLRAKVEADNAFDEDNDYSTFGKRYTERMTKARDGVLKNISNGVVREAFLAEADLDTARGFYAINEKARGKEKDANRADLMARLDGNVQSALQADSKTGLGLLESTKELILASRDKGYLTAQEAEKLRQDTAAKYAEQRITMLPWDKQVEVLKGGMTEKEGSLPVFAKSGTEVDFLPPDRRVALLRAAEAKNKQGLSIRMADEIAGPMAGGGMNLAGWMQKAQGIQDPELREAVESRLTTEYNRRHALVTQADRANRDAAWKVVMQTNSIDGLSGAQLSSLSHSDISAMQTWVERSGRVPENPAVYNAMNLMRIKEPEKFATFDMNQLNGRLPVSQVRQFSDWQVAANSKEEKTENLRATASSALKLARGTLASAGIDTTPKEDSPAAEKLAAFESQLIDRLDAFQKDKKGKATEKELLTIVDSLLLEGKVRDGWLWDSSKRAYEVKPEDRDKFYVPFDKIPAGEKAMIVDALRQAKQPITNERVEELFAKRKMKGTSVGR